MGIIRQSKKDLLDAVKSKNVVLFGAGSMALRLLTALDLHDKVRCICENNRDRLGGRLFGIDIVGVDALGNIDADEVVVVIASDSSQEEMAEQVQSFGDFTVYFAKTILSNVFETVACMLFDHRDLIEKVSSMLIDDTSRRIYNEVIYRRMLYGECDFSDLMIEGDDIYILPQMFSENILCDEVIADCGAFTGDTIDIFVKFFSNKVKKIYAFECGSIQLEKLRRKVERMAKLSYCPEIEIVPYAVSDVNEMAEFYQWEKRSGSFLKKHREIAWNDKYNSDIYTVETVALDSFFPADEKITIIKMDIEGSEYNALKGASGLIKQQKPKLMISIYHLGEDFFRLALFIKELVPEYKLAVRHHKEKHVDTVLYAWV